MHRLLAATAGFAVLAVLAASAGLAQAAEPADDLFGDLVARTRSLVLEQGTAEADASLHATAMGDCGQAEAADPPDTGQVDIREVVLSDDCTGGLGVGVLTYEGWDDSQLDSLVVLLDTDRDPTTGCNGAEYAVTLVEDGGAFPGYVFAQPSSCETGSPVARAAGRRTGDPGFIAVFWSAAAIGSPPSLSFRSAVRATGSSTFDVAPDPDLPGVALEHGGTPRPIAQARPIDAACPGDVAPAGFADVAPSSPHRPAIDCIVGRGIARGTGAGTYGPDRGVTRAQMATFVAGLVRASGAALPGDAPDAFADDDGNPHEADIDALAAVRIVTGTGPGTFAPSSTVPRDQMASFLARAVEFVRGTPLPDPEGDYFSDDGRSIHERNIDAVAAAGIATGVEGSLYRPGRPVRRDQLASFVARALALLVDPAAGGA